MGRGRAKAKQTRVARDLKYRSFDTDFDMLSRELRGDQEEEIIEDHQYSELAEKYADFGEDEDRDIRPTG